MTTAILITALLSLTPMLTAAEQTPHSPKKEQTMSGTSQLNRIRLEPYPGTRTSASQMIHITSPWNSDDYMAVNFPEHCWGNGLPNVGHMSEEPIECPWVFDENGSRGVLERKPAEGITVRFTAEVDGLTVRTGMEIENRTDQALTDIRVLVCTRPRYMSTFCEFNYDPTYVWIDGEAANMAGSTTYDGPLPDEGRTPCWAMNLPDGPDNSDMGWFQPGSGPGRIVNELADPGLIAVHEKGNDQRWVATIWDPARMVFANPSLPCIHSDPQPPDCPPGETVTVSGLILFHDGDAASLQARAIREMKQEGR